VLSGQSGGSPTAVNLSFLDQNTLRTLNVNQSDIEYTVAVAPSKNRQQPVVCRMVSSRMLRRMALVITDVSEELSSYFIRVTRIGELGTLAATSKLRTLRRNFFAACEGC
jgi:hypothetical protein